MSDGRAPFGFDRLVLVADLIDEASTVPAHLRRDLEKTDRQTLAALKSAVAELGLELCHYREPAELARNADAHREDLVWAIYGGEESRNRLSLVPAICESFGLSYIGPDGYGRFLAQDKEVTKRLALDCGLTTPAWRTLRSPADAKVVRGLEPPLVVKPVMEGSSIGLSQANLTKSTDEAVTLAVELNARLHQPVLLERFAPGREVAYSVIQGPYGSIWAFSEIAMRDDPTYFERRIFDAEEKLNPGPGRFVRQIDDALLPSDRDAIERFLAAFGRFGYCRVDGRLVDGRFHFLEMTPDAWIGPSGQFAAGFIQKGFTYRDVIEAVVRSASLNLRDRSASGSGRVGA